LLDRAAAVSAINERIERIGSSTKEACLFHKLTAKSRPGKKYRSLAEPALFMKEAGDGGNSRAMAAHCASDQHEERSGTLLIHRPPVPLKKSVRPQKPFSTVSAINDILHCRKAASLDEHCRAFATGALTGYANPYRCVLLRLGPSLGPNDCLRAAPHLPSTARPVRHSISFIGRPHADWL
jgi:hypothetical protein